MRPARSRSPYLQARVLESTKAISICRACGEEWNRYLGETRWKLRDRARRLRADAQRRAA
jgi:hypothetical protein